MPGVRFPQRTVDDLIPRTVIHGGIHCRKGERGSEESRKCISGADVISEEGMRDRRRVGLGKV